LGVQNEESKSFSNNLEEERKVPNPSNGSAFSAYRPLDQYKKGIEQIKEENSAKEGDGLN